MDDETMDDATALMLLRVLGGALETATRERDEARARLARRREAGFAARTILDATATESALDAARRVVRERDDARAAETEMQAAICGGRLCALAGLPMQDGAL